MPKSNVCLCAPYLMKRLTGFNQICEDTTFGQDEK